MDFELELKRSIITALKTSPRMEAVGGRVYDNLPEGVRAPQSPYVVMGSWVTNSEKFDCIDGWTCQVSIDVFTYGPNEHGSTALCSKVASSIRKTLRSEEFELMDGSYAAIEHRVTRLFEDAGNPIQRANVSFEAVMDESTS